VPVHEKKAKEVVGKKKTLQNFGRNAQKRKNKERMKKMKIKKLLSLLVSLAMVMSFAVAPASAEVAGLSGAGTADEPYEIATLEDLVWFRDQVNAGNKYADTYFQLTNDISLSGLDWEPIGNGTRSGSGYSGNAFSGNFDGYYCTISDLTTTQANTADVQGLFGVVDGGSVSSLFLENVAIDSAKKSAGGAIGLMVNNAYAEGITVSGSVKAPDGVGGVIGRMTLEGTICDITNNATVTATDSQNGAAGGIVSKAYYTGVGWDM